MEFLYEQIKVARATIRKHSSLEPRVGLILGSGLGDLADELDQAVVLPYRQLPGFARPSIAGHRGELALGLLEGQPVAVLRGRFHFYEGYDMAEITFPVRVLRALGCEVLLVTNAAGGLHADWPTGSIMLINDHIFLPGMAGFHPLRGQHDERLGARFPAMLHAYDGELAHLAADVAAEQQLSLQQGVYVMLSGPSFESAAELRMLRAWGGDAVGMSTAPEVVVARQEGMRVLGLSLITNQALPEGNPASHAEVIEAGALARPKFAALLRGVLRRFPPPA